MRLKDYIQTEKLTYEKAGELLSLAVPHVWQLANGVRRASPETAAHISAVTKGAVSIGELLYATGIPDGAVMVPSDPVDASSANNGADTAADAA